LFTLIKINKGGRAEENSQQQGKMFQFPKLSEIHQSASFKEDKQAIVVIMEKKGQAHKK
jgi:hypothetical protein